MTAPSALRSTGEPGWRFSALAANASPRHDTRTHAHRPKLWTPFFLRRPTLVVFIVIFVLLMLAFAILFGISNRDQGLASANPNWYYLWVYGPTAAFTFLAAIWAPVEYRAKQVEPWVLMATKFRPAKESLLLDYIERLNILTLFASLRRRHWLAFSGTAATFVIIVATVASSGLLVSSTIRTHKENAKLVIRDAFTVPKLPQAGSRPAMNTYGILAANISFPAGTYDRHAIQSFEPYDGHPYETMSAIVDVFEAKLDCEVAIISTEGELTYGKNTLPHKPSKTNNDGVGAAVFVGSSFTLRVPSCPNPLYLEITGPKLFSFNGSSCGNTSTPTDNAAAIDRFVALWGHRGHSSDPLIPDLGVVCVPSYSIRKGRVELSRRANGDVLPTVAFLGSPESDGRVLDGITAWDVLTEFVRSAVESSDAIFQGDYGSRGGETRTGLEPLIQTVVSKGHAEDRVAALSEVFGLVTAQVADQYLRQAAEEPLAGTTTAVENRLIVSTASFALLESMLLLLCLIAGYLLVVSSKAGTSCDTSTLAGLAAVLARSGPALSNLDGAGKTSEKALGNRLQKVEFRTNIVSDEGQPVFRIESATTEEANPLLSEVRPEAEMGDSTERHSSWRKFFCSMGGLFRNKAKEGLYQPFAVTIPGQVLLVLALPALVVTLELLYRRSERDGGLVEIDDSSNAVYYAWTYIPTATMVGLGLWLTAFSYTTKLLGPYSSLWRGRAPAETTMTENYLHTLAILSLWRAARKKQWGIAAPALASMLTPFLTIVASGLLSTRPSMTSTTAMFQRVDSFNVAAINQSNGLSFANLALASNLSDPLWTYKDLVMPQLTGIDGFDSTEKGLARRVKFDALPAIRGNFNCTVTFATEADPDCGGRGFIGTNYKKVGDSFENPNTDGIFLGNGYFGTMISLQSLSSIISYYKPECPSVLVSFGHTTDYVVDQVSNLVCSPYAEEVLVSASFTIPEWELDADRSPSSPPPVIVHPGSAPKVVPSINISSPEFIHSFSMMVFANPAGLDTSFESGGLFGLAVYGRNGTPIAELAGPENVGNLKDAVERTFRAVMAQFLNNGRESLDLAAGEDAQTFTGAVTTPNAGRSRLYQSAISTRILEGLLAVMFVCVMLSYMTHRHLRRLLPKNPCSIGAAASLLAGSDLLRRIPHGAEWMTKQERNELEVFREGLFGMGWWGVKEPPGQGGDGNSDQGADRWYGIDFQWGEGRADAEK
ncbi:hypothetical protein B0T14DRAFT_528606 [Immersiella caudata]|uniref:Uncharacterized protein n=1 Tax=Immersiella caudata TaxID=314043 RepID=A0AA39WFK8_9PEZI|nr:hypothetical protein B0T14DRAFT_528606 [Immersiella caudata]